MKFKRNQTERAILKTLNAQGARADEVRFRLKRLLAADRSLGRRPNARDEADRHYAFYSQEPPGKGGEIMFSSYEAFALLAAIVLLEHGIPQARVIKVLRNVRRQFEAAHTQTLKKDPRVLFDRQAILAQAKPGTIATDNTDPVFLAFARLTDSAVDDQAGGAAVAVCHGQPELWKFIGKHSIPGVGATFFEFVRLMHTLAANLAETRASKRGRRSDWPS